MTFTENEIGVLIACEFLIAIILLKLERVESCYVRRADNATLRFNLVL